MTRGRATARSVLFVFAFTLLGLAMILLPTRARRATAAPRAKASASVSVSPSASASASASGSGSVSASASSASAAALSGIPRGKGLPVHVAVGVYFVDIRSFDDTKGEFDATVDLRMRWSDPRLRYDASDESRGFKEYRGKEAESQLDVIWSPSVDILNRGESGVAPLRRVRVFPNGDVELLVRTAGKFKTDVDAEQFPFDRQYLRIELVPRDETLDLVTLEFGRNEVQFSEFAPSARVSGWDLGIVELRSAVAPGFRGEQFSKVTASLMVDRDPMTGLGPIFIPLVASLLIPLLAVWMNKANEEGFEVEAFELANMGIGGLFSVIALSFAVYTSYSMIAGNDNTVTRLFALNYAMLSASLTIVVLLFRFNLVLRWFGPYVHREVFRFIVWAMPVLILAIGAAFLLVAAA